MRKQTITWIYWTFFARRRTSNYIASRQRRIIISSKRCFNSDHISVALCLPSKWICMNPNTVTSIYNYSQTTRCLLWIRGCFNFVDANYIDKPRSISVVIHSKLLGAWWSPRWSEHGQNNNTPNKTCKTASMMRTISGPIENNQKAERIGVRESRFLLNDITSIQVDAIPTQRHATDKWKFDQWKLIEMRTFSLPQNLQCAVVPIEPIVLLKWWTHWQTACLCFQNKFIQDYTF